MINNFEIIPEKGIDKLVFGISREEGIDKLVFGISREEVKKIMGEPNETDMYSYSEESQTETYFYDELGISFSFDSEEDFKLCEIAVDTEEAHIENKLRVGVSKEEALKFASEKAYGEPEYEELEGEEFKGQELISFPAKGINFWIEEGTLTSIQMEIVYEG